MFSHITASSINHVLRGESWALRLLQPFAGHIAKFDVFPFSISLTVSDTGEVLGSAPNAAAHTVFRCSPALALRVLGGDQAAYQQVEMSGDTEFGQAVAFVIRNARWDAEEDLARVFGDVIAHRAVGAAQGLLRLQARAAASITRNLADYLVEERPLIARRLDVETFVRDVDTLRDDTERLEQRISRLRLP